MPIIQAQIALVEELIELYAHFQAIMKQTGQECMSL